MKNYTVADVDTHAKRRADTMIQRYQHCSRLAVKALVAVLRCTVLLSVFYLMYNQNMIKKECGDYDK